MNNQFRYLSLRLALFVFVAVPLAAPFAAAQTSGAMAAKTGQGTINDWPNNLPGDRHKVSPADLPAPNHTESATNFSKVVPRPPDAMLKAPAGFTVEQLAMGFEDPRVITTAPNGDLFVAENGGGKITILRLNGAGKEPTRETFASDLTQPYGIAFYPLGSNPQYVYVGNTNSVVRFPYRNGDLKARGAAEKIADIPGGGKFGGGHSTRNLAFSRDGKKLYVAVGSKNNISDAAEENERANVLEMNPDGSGRRVYASGTRNPVGLIRHPSTGQLWITVNERDRLGDDLVPDYVTHIVDNGFYGWPWYYIGQNHDPRMGEKPEMKSKVLVPDVLFQSHSAPVSVFFYTGKQFPAQYRNGAFVSLHGSWNRAKRTGYKLVFVPAPGGKATGEYVDFITGFVVDDANVWGRPQGIAQTQDGSLVFSDDASNSVWRVTYTGSQQRASR
ncbi:MAG TPA: sorbosone dehydrogenase family protein [Terriglobales bacterium]|nr:sorbosone dehydrogenase family protein [Terriglobales bacterium]